MIEHLKNKPRINFKIKLQYSWTMLINNKILFIQAIVL